MLIKKTFGKINKIIDLSKTAKEITITPDESLEFIAGHFINLFLEIDGEKIRRAFSISSADTETGAFTISIRLSPNGKMTPLFWNTAMTGQIVEIMGPLGLNTTDKMTKNKIYLFAFGIGVGVVKSLAEHFITKNPKPNLTIVTGSRTNDEILYKDFLNELAKNNKGVSVKHVISKTGELTNQYPEVLIGYIQHHIGEYDFNDADIYVCGQESACNELIEKVKISNPENCNFFIEGFH